MGKRKNSRRGRGDRTAFEPDSPIKITKLCSQAGDAISLSLASAVNATLRELTVVRVEPARGAAALRVVIDPGEVDSGECLEALERAGGYLRSELARTLNRKRTPTLEFFVVSRASRPATRPATRSDGSDASGSEASTRPPTGPVGPPAPSADD